MSVTKKRLLYDIETSQMIFKGWRTGKQYVGGHQILTNTKIISIHWKFEDEKKVHHLDWGLNAQCDKKLLEKFIPILNSATEIIAHNGNSFDIRWIRTRALAHGLEMRHHYSMIDTYRLAKKYLNLPSYSLKEICKYYGLESKKDAGGIETWNKIQFDKDREALDHLLFYGDGDIVSLQAVWEKFRPYIKPSLHYAAMSSNEKWWCPECGGICNYSSRYVTAAGTPQHYLLCRDKECRTTHKVSNVTLNKFYDYKRLNGIK